MNDNRIIKWRDESDLSRGFIIDLENVSASQLFTGIYSEPHFLVNAFSDAFLLMGFSPKDAEKHANDLYQTTREQLNQLIDRLRSQSFVQTPANMELH